jgi:hypothetical protein
MARPPMYEDWLFERSIDPSYNSLYNTFNWSILMIIVLLFVYVLCSMRLLSQTYKNCKYFQTLTPPEQWGG